MKNIIKIAFVLYLSLLVPPCGLAGTAQIYSPAGLPQSSTQSYAPPTPGNTPTVTFPTPPLPLNPGVLPGFSGSALPLNSGNTQQPVNPATGGNGAQPPLPSTPGTNDVESFFQCNQVMPTSRNNQKKSRFGTPGKVIWHILDNLGVPMFVGKDNDLDPSLRQSYMLPPSIIPTHNITQITPHGIPESELEGTEVTPGNDAKKQAP